MKSILSTEVLVVASICYGIAIAILGVLGSSAIALVATIGALILGGLWAIRGVLLRKPDGG
jgi:hypothetical protein